MNVTQFQMPRGNVHVPVEGRRIRLKPRDYLPRFINLNKL